MRVRKSVWLPGLFVAVILGLVACGSEATATPVPTSVVSPTAEASSQQGSSSLSPEESDYLKEVRRAELSSVAIFQEFRTVVTQSYAVREALIAALLQAGVGTPFIEKNAILGKLDIRRSASARTTRSGWKQPESNCGSTLKPPKQLLQAIWSGFQFLMDS